MADFLLRIGGDNVLLIGGDRLELISAAGGATVNLDLGAYTLAGPEIDISTPPVTIVDLATGTFDVTGYDFPIVVSGLTNVNLAKGSYTLAGRAIDILIPGTEIRRLLPSGVLREANREESAEHLLVFLTISHSDLATPIRVVSDPVDFVLDGETYTGFRFNISLLSDDERPPFTQLTIQNVDRQIGTALQNLDDPARIKMEVIAGSEFDLTVDPRTEISSAARTYVADQLYLVGVDVDALNITGRLQTWDYTQEVWPGTLAVQEAFPGLFR